MKIAYNPKSGAALQTAPDNNDITFDLAGKIIYARGEGFKGTDTTYNIFRKASESVEGYDGLVPAPNYNSNSENRFLREDGTWCIPDAGTFDGMDSDRFVTTHNISEADTDKRSINVRFEPKWTDTNSSSYILRVGSSTEGLPDNCGDGNLLHIQGRFSDTAFQLLSGWYNNSLYFRSGNEVDGVDNTTKEEADTGLFKNAWNRIPFFTDLTGSNIKLTGYQLDANNFESITSNDTVSSALSKLECKAQFVYSWLTSDADDADEKINKWHEVEHFLEGIEETTLNSILNTKADKATTIQGYGLWEKYTDLNDAPMGAFFCGGTSVANSPENGNYISGITLAKDKNAQFRTQLGFVNNRIFTRQENGANKWSQWRELAFLGDVAKKATTLAGYGITDAVTLNTEQTITGVKTFTNGIKTPIIVNQTSDNALFIGATDNYYCDLNTQLSPGYSAIIPLFQKIGSATSTTGDFGSARKGVIRLSGNASESQLLFDHYNATIHYRGSTSNGAFTEWKRIAFLDNVVTLSGNQTITGEKIFQQGANKIPLRFRNTVDSAYIQAGSSGTNNTASLAISGLNVSMLTSLQVYSTSTAFHGNINIKGVLSSDSVSTINTSGYSKYIQSLGRPDMITGTTKPGYPGISMVEAYGNNTGYPVAYGNIIQVQGITAPGAGQLCLGWTGTDVSGNIYYRSLRDQTNSWSEWKQLAFIDNIIPYLETSEEIKKSAIGYGYPNAGFASAGGFISAIHHNGKYGFQLNAINTGSDIWYRGLNNGTFTEWKRLAFKETTLSGYGITDAVPFLNMVNASNLKSIGVGYVNANGANGENGGIISFGSASHQTQIHSDYSGGNIHWRVNSNGTLTNWKNLLDSNNYSNYAVTLGTEQEITGTKIFTSQLKSNVATGTAPLVVNSTTMVANLNANYLGGMNKDSFQKAVYDYINVSGTADTTTLPTVIAPSIYNGTNSIGGNFKYYDTKFFSTQTKTSNRCQLAYGYDVDSIHFRRYKDGTWYDWKKLAFTEGTDNLKITNSSARTTYVKDSTHSMFFGYSDGSYNRGLYDNSQSNWIMYTDSSNQTFINQWLGNVGIKTGNTTLTAALQVGGSILASGDITAYSDRRLKSNIQTLENRGYVEPVTFEKDGKQCIGFVAQDVEEKYPELVNSEGEYLSLNYQQYTAVLQAQIIELDKRIKELENGFSKQ